MIFLINSVKELAQSVPPVILPSTPIDDSKPTLNIMEISESAVIKIITSLRHSKAKDAYGLDNTFLKSHKESLPHCSFD